MRVDQQTYLSDLREQIELQLTQIDRLGKHDTSSLETSRPDGGWSVAQCLHHLHLTYDLYRPRIDPLIPDLIANKNGVFRSRWLGRMSVKNTRPDSKQRIKMKMKTFDFFEPKQDISFEKAKNQLVGDLKWQIEVMINVADKNICDPRVQSAVKWMKFRLGDAFAFLLAHNERHLLQAERNLRD